MRKFEYKILDADKIEPDLTKSDFPHIDYEEDREKNLNKYGKEGWEFVESSKTSNPLNDIKYIFKREIK